MVVGRRIKERRKEESFSIFSTSTTSDGNFPWPVVFFAPSNNNNRFCIVKKQHPRYRISSYHFFRIIYIHKPSLSLLFFSIRRELPPFYIRIRHILELLAGLLLSSQRRWFSIFPLARSLTLSLPLFLISSFIRRRRRRWAVCRSTLHQNRHRNNVEKHFHTTRKLHCLFEMFLCHLFDFALDDKENIQFFVGYISSGFARASSTTMTMALVAHLLWWRQWFSFQKTSFHHHHTQPRIVVVQFKRSQLVATVWLLVKHRERSLG